MTTETKRTPPVGYEWPGMTQDLYTHYYLEPQANYGGATPQFMVMEIQPGAVRILAERSFLHDAIAIVDALRDVHARGMGWSIG